MRTSLVTQAPDMAIGGGSLNGLKCLVRLLVGATSGPARLRCAIGSQCLRGSGGPVWTGWKIFQRDE